MEEKTIWIVQPTQGKGLSQIIDDHAAAMEEVEKIGYLVMSSSSDPEESDLEEIKKIGTKRKELYRLGDTLRWISACDAVYLCNGWQTDRVSWLIYHAALQFGLAIIIQERPVGDEWEEPTERVPF